MSRIDRTKGCLLKTIIQNDESGNGFESFGKNTLLKIEYHGDDSFIAHLNYIKSVHCLAGEHTKVDISNYIDEDLSYYGIYDFTNSDNINERNCEGSVLTLNVFKDSLEFVYNFDLFPDIYIKNMASNIESTIDIILNAPDSLCGDVDIISDSEKELIFEFSKGKVIEVDNEKTLAMAFHENALNNPDMLAIDDGDNRLSYSELDLLSNSVAWDLKNNHDVSFGDNIALILPRNYHFVEMVLALNKIGATFIPIDSEYPLKRMEHMLNIAEVQIIITTRDFADLHDFNIDFICIEDLNRNYEDYLEPIGSGDDLFAIVFTSGTTGLPKGVTVSNKQISGIALSLRDVYNSAPGDISGCYSSFSFGGSFRIYFALYCAESSRIFNDEERNDSLLFIKALEKQPLNDLILPPSIGLMIFENEEIDLKHLSLAGSKIEDLPKKYNSTQMLVNVYGATETLMAVTSYLRSDMKSMPVGKPLANTWAYVLDRNYNQVPIGTPGEIYLCGEYISPGYYNAPEKTRKSFIENPFSDCEGNRIMYRTGDIGFFNFEGEIEIIGREDDQLSLRSFRIESMEIINKMKKFEGISQVYLDVDYDNLIAYYTANEDVDIAEVKKSLEMELPNYMVPGLFVELDEIPLNSNGKIDKFAIKEIFNESSEVIIEDEVLQSVVNCFKKVLGHNVSINDDFVELGGNSLSAMRLQISLKDELDVTLYSHEIMELSTPANIANHIKYGFDVHSSINVNYTFNDLCPLSESQLNVYLDERVQLMGTAYNNPFKIEFNGNHDVKAIENAVYLLFDSYPILSARVVENQKILSFSFDAKPKVSIGSIEDIENFVNPFELNESLSRFLIADDGSFLCFDCHHLIFDGSSLNILVGRFFDILNESEENDEYSIDEGTVDDGILRQISFEESINQDYMDEAKLFFENVLCDSDEAYNLLPSVKLSGKFEVDTPSFDGEFDGHEIFHSLNIDGKILKGFLQSHSITHNQFFTIAFAYALSRFAGSSKVLFNLIEDGRGYVDLSDSIGMYVRTLPLLLDCKNQTVDSFIESSSSIVHGAMKYDLYPFRSLVNDFDLSSDVYFQYSHDIFKHVGDEDSNFNVCELKHKLVGNLAFFVLNLSEDSFGVKVSYSDKFSRDFIEKFVESFDLILSQLIEVDCLSEIRYISSMDLSVLDSYNENKHYLDYVDVLDAFNDNLRRHGDNPLVSYNDHCYSYSQGAFIADRIAKELLDLGINPQDCVGFLVPRSEHYMFSLLGILSAAAIYVPLDDTLPDERLKFIVDDTDTKAVIVTDDTFKRGSDLFEDSKILNISPILDEDIGSLDNLDVSYGKIACILYTSGSTGIPKGVRITRKAIVNLCESYVDRFELSSDDVYGLYASIGFDAASQAICQTIYAGACLSVIPDDIRLDMDGLNDYFIAQGITHTMITTQVGKLFMESIDDSPLKILTVGGEKLGEVESPDDYILVDGFGPTETFAFISSIENSNKLDSSSIGRLNRNSKAYILDSELRRVPCGAIGELYLSGYQVSDGYMNREDETAKSFIKNPFDDDESYSVIYRTGDMVRLLPDGSFGIVGRRDGQVKIRGNRVELPEIESLIREIDYVEDVTVQTVVHDANHEIVAYLVVSQDFDDDVLKNAVCNYVAESKPEYMVPSFVIHLDSIPLNLNGKVDKRALPKIDLESLHVDYIAPRNDIEKEIVKAFEIEFNQERLGIYDDFLKLGGDSLSAIKIKSLLTFDVDVRTILNAKTPYKIAQIIEDADDNGHGFKLLKKGTNDKSIFLIPDIVGLSFVFSDLIDAIDFEVNVYVIDDFKHDLTIDEIMKISDNDDLTFKNYYDAIKDEFKDGDIIAGYSLGCIYASLIAEKLEKDKRIEKCILIDGTLDFTNNEKMSREDVIEYLDDGISRDFDEKLIEIALLNSIWNFHTPKINSFIVYLSASNQFKDELEIISDNFEYIPIDSTHEGIIKGDVERIVKYFK